MTLNISSQNLMLLKVEIQSVIEEALVAMVTLNTFHFQIVKKQATTHIQHTGCQMRKLQLWEETTEQDTKFGLLRMVTQEMVVSVNFTEKTATLVCTIGELLQKLQTLVIKCFTTQCLQ